MKLNGFSLVELSIVLVILGLLTGGILAGQSLIRAAELRSVTTQYSQLRTATASFRDKYFSIPGDFNKAESFWGTMSTGTCPIATAGTGTQTCNGNGDGQVTATGAVGQTAEFSMFWQHLANAGLIEGSYTPIRNATASPGIDGPAGRLNNAMWTVLWRGAILPSSTALFEGDYGNALAYGVSGTTAPAMKAEEAWNIDTKMDDGRPGLGSIRTWEGDGAPCNTVAVDNTNPIASTAAYNLTNTTISCRLSLPSF